MPKQKDDLEKALKKIQKAMPTNAVKELQYEYAPDSTGDPALWLWVVLKATPDAQSPQTLIRLREKIEEIWQPFLSDTWPYIHFKTEDEIDEQAYLKRLAVS
jgi:hypothetical protein